LAAQVQLKKGSVDRRGKDSFGRLGAVDFQ